MTIADAPVAYPFGAPPSRFAPNPELRALAAPVTRAQLPDGTSAWLVTGHAELRQLLTDQVFSRTLAAQRESRHSGLAASAADSILGLDPPEHSRLRKLVASAFTARRVEQLRPSAARIADGLLDQMIAGPRPADLVSGFSLPLPVRVICAMLGVPPQDQGTFRGWSDLLLSSPDTDRAEVTAALDALGEYFAGLIARKRAAPADDLMTALIAARDENDRLSERELVRMCITVLVAGHETTANQISMSLLNLLTSWPGELERLRADLSLIPSAVEELLRFVQLGAGTFPLGRVTAAETELGGVRIPAGELLLPFFGVANRDSSEFTDPDRLDLGRTVRSHVTFGAGVHHCLGAQLARMELQEAYRALLTRLPGLRLAVPLEALRFKPKMVVYSLCELPVAWDE